MMTPVAERRRKDLKTVGVATPGIFSVGLALRLSCERTRKRWQSKWRQRTPLLSCASSSFEWVWPALCVRITKDTGGTF